MKLRFFIPLCLIASLLESGYAAEAPELEDPVVSLQPTAKPKKSPAEIQSERQQGMRTLLGTVDELLDNIETDGQPLRVISNIEVLFSQINKRLPGIADKEALAQKYELLKAALLEKKITYDSAHAPFEIPPLPEDRATNYYPSFQEELPAIGKQTKDFAQLTHFPCGYSPDRGWVLTNNGFLLNILNGSKTIEPSLLALAEELFNGNLARTTRTLSLTGLTMNVTSALPPDIVAKLIRLLPALPTREECTSAYLDKLTSFFNEWYHAYSTQHSQITEKIKSAPAFRKSAHRFIKLLTTCAHIDLQLTTDFLLASLSLLSEKTEFVPDKVTLMQTFSQHLQQAAFQPLFYYESSCPHLRERYSSRYFMKTAIRRELEPVMFLLKSKQQAKDFRIPLSFDTEGENGTYRGITFAICGENAVRNLISLFFYNPKTEALDLSMIPQSLQAEIDPELKQFMKLHGKLQKSLTPTAEEREYFKQAKTAWLDLIENRTGILYSEKIIVSYNLETTTSNIVLLLQQLLGASAQKVTGTDQEKFISIIKLFSTPDKHINTSVTNNTPDLFSVCLTSNYGSVFSYRVVFKIYEGQHAETRFLHTDHTAKPDAQHAFSRTLYFAGKAMSQFILGTIKKDPVQLINDLIETACLSTKEDFVCFFRDYTHQDHSCPFPQIFYLPYFLERVKNKTEHSQLYEAMQEVGFTYQQAFEESVKERHPNRIDWFELATTENINYSPEESTLITLFENIPVLNNVQLYNNDTPDFNGLSYTQKLFTHFSKHHFDLTKAYTFIQGTMTPLAWALETENLYAIEYLLKQGVLPTEKEVAVILEKASSFCTNYSGYLLSIVSSLVRQGIRLDQPYPFRKGMVDPLTWAFHKKNLVMPLVLLTTNSITLEDSDHEKKELLKTIALKWHPTALSSRFKEDVMLLFRSYQILYGETFLCFILQKHLIDKHLYADKKMYEQKLSIIFEFLQDQKFNLTKLYNFEGKLMSPLAWALKNKSVTRSYIEHLLNAGVSPTESQIDNIFRTFAEYYHNNPHFTFHMIYSLQKAGFSFTKSYSFLVRLETPMEWCLSNKQSTIMAALCAHNVIPIDSIQEEALAVIELETRRYVEGRNGFYSTLKKEKLYDLLMATLQWPVARNQPFTFVTNKLSQLTDLEYTDLPPEAATKILTFVTNMKSFHSLNSTDLFNFFTKLEQDFNVNLNEPLPLSEGNMSLLSWAISHNYKKIIHELLKIEGIHPTPEERDRLFEYVQPAPCCALL
jgi:hypothetical protein